jgi:hypothetical protein
MSNYPLSPMEVPDRAGQVRFFERMYQVASTGRLSYSLFRTNGRPVMRKKPSVTGGHKRPVVQSPMVDIPALRRLFKNGYPK